MDPSPRSPADDLDPTDWDQHQKGEGLDGGEMLGALDEQVSLLESQSAAVEIKTAQELWRDKMAERRTAWPDTPGVPGGEPERAMTTGQIIN